MNQRLIVNGNVIGYGDIELITTYSINRFKINSTDNTKNKDNEIVNFILSMTRTI